MDIKTLQDNLPWGNAYSDSFNNDSRSHADLEHALLHVFKAAGNIVTLVEAADHVGSMQWTDSARRTFANSLADIIISTVRMASVAPEISCDLSQLILDRLRIKNPGVDLSVLEFSNHTEDEESIADSYGDWWNRVDPHLFCEMLRDLGWVFDGPTQDGRQCLKKSRQVYYQTTNKYIVVPMTKHQGWMVEMERAAQVLADSLGIDYVVSVHRILRYQRRSKPFTPKAIVEK